MKLVPEAVEVESLEITVVSSLVMIVPLMLNVKHGRIVNSNFKVLLYDLKREITILPTVKWMHLTTIPSGIRN